MRLMLRKLRWRKPFEEYSDKAALFRERLLTFSPFDYWNGQTSDELVEMCRRLALTQNLRMLHRTAKLIQNPIGRYYESVALNNRWSDPDFYHSLVVSDFYRARTLLTAGQSHRCCGQFGDALRTQVEAIRIAYSQNDFVTFFHAQREVAILSSIDGNHPGALSRLESLLPLGRKISQNFPVPYLDLYNSLAVELGELGRIDAAFGAINICLASPYAMAYPEWSETRAELVDRGRRASRSVVAVIRHIEPENVLHGNFPSTETVPYHAPDGDDAGVVNFQNWKLEMAKGQNKVKSEQQQGPERSEDELVVEMLELMTRTTLDRDQIQRIIAIVKEKKPTGSD